MPQPPRRPLNYEPALSDPTRPPPPTSAPPPSPRSKPPLPPRRSCAWCQRVRVWLGLRVSPPNGYRSATGAATATILCRPAPRLSTSRSLRSRPGLWEPAEACRRSPGEASEPLIRADVARPGLVGAEGFEPPPLPCIGSALPLSYAPRSGDRKHQIGCGGRSPVCDIRLPQIAAPGQSIASRTFVVVRTS